MSQNEQCDSIDLGELSSVTGGFNPFKSAWNEARKIGNEVKQDVQQVGHEVVDATRSGIEYVKQHPEVLQQGARSRAI